MRPLKCFANVAGRLIRSSAMNESRSRVPQSAAGAVGQPMAPSAVAVSAAEMRARAVGVEAFRAFQQRQEELRRRRGKPSFSMHATLSIVLHVPSNSIRKNYIVGEVSPSFACIGFLLCP